ncbi:hypothetical protein K469DRAFT_725841 [Zopfia rhizophila CBS 207.26]|uniref:Uncharacterized protein n=1 Tax=Zopfia rhizophila CBS 207.26 TaxID=1314779 RepID=A0A6A6EU40_9PEZI|nr:hypothetical protein K469DRAFT_725841 [Zopfia rhizophila CBS 207.26]
MAAPKTSNPVRRNGPMFKPPRSVKPTTQSNKLTGTAKRILKKATASRPSFEPATTLISTSSEQEDEDAASDSDRDEEMDDNSDNERRSAPTQTAQEIVRDPIPPQLLARLLYEGFEDKDMKIQKGAMDLVGKYMEIFVREAMARAQFERDDANKGGGISDGFLQVEDLEKLTPQLVLDF